MYRIDKRRRDLNTILESKRINFTEISETLIDDYLAMINDKEHVGKYIGCMKIFTKEEELEWVRGKLSENAPVYSMIEKETGDYIGNIEFMDVHDGVGELGISIACGKQDRGFGSEAIPVFVEYGMNKLGLTRIFLKAYPDNARAIHVYEKCGFKEYDRTDEDVFMEIMK